MARPRHVKVGPLTYRILVDVKAIKAASDDATIGTGGELSFVNNIFAPHYDYRVRAVRVED